MKLHSAALAQYRLRIEQLYQSKIDADREENGHNSPNIKLLTTRSKEIQRALKLVSSDLEAEAETQQLRILGIKVDTTMLEGLVGLVSAIGVTLWQAYSSTNSSSSS